MFILADWNLFIGRFHPLVVHLPIGMIVLSAILVWLTRKGKRDGLRASIKPILGWCVITSALSVIMGLMLANGDSYNPNAINWHKWLGIATAVVSLFCWYFYDAAVTKQKPTFTFSFIGLLGVLVFTGHLGGQITHGKSYLAQYAPAFLAPLLGEVENVKDDYTIDELRMDSTEMYVDIIKPLMDSKCIQCHNEDKSNGGLILTSHEAIIKGGNGGSVLINGDPLESKLFARTVLPQSSSKFMPPEGIPLTFKEQKILSWWIENGHGNKDKLRSLTIPKDILLLLEEIYGYSHKPKSFVEKHQIPAADSASLAQINESAFKAKPIASSTNFLDIMVKADIKTLSQKHLDQLMKTKEHITWLDIPGKEITDDLLKSIGELTNLSKLKIQKNPISDAGIKHLTNLQNLEVLNLYGTNLTDACVDDLIVLKKLKKLFVWQTKISKEGVDKLIENLPNTEIVAGLEFNSPTIQGD